MPSNYFTRTRGLHPTPSACFPPRIPPTAGDITGTFWLSPDPIHNNQIGQLNWTIHNTHYPLGEPISFVCNTPGVSILPLQTLLNGVPGFIAGTCHDTASEVVTGVATVFFANNQTRTYHFAYQILVP